MNGYSVKLKYASRELTPRERIMVKDTANAIKLDSACNEIGGINITVDYYAVLEIHNEKSKDRKDYENYLIMSKNGDKYVTGSPSFWNAFTQIADEMEGETDEWAINVYKLDSKNYKDKQFLTCSLI